MTIRQHMYIILYCTYPASVFEPSRLLYCADMRWDEMMRSSCSLLLLAGVHTHQQADFSARTSCIVQHIRTLKLKQVYHVRRSRSSRRKGRSLLDNINDIHKNIKDI